MKICPWMKTTLAFHAEITAHQDFPFQQEKLSEAVSKSLVASNLAINVTQPVKHCLDS